MSIQAKFEQAQQDVNKLTERPSNENLLKLYALFKQSTEGDNSNDRPGGFDFKAIAKHDAWASESGKDKEQAMTEYVELVESLLGATQG